MTDGPQTHPTTGDDTTADHHDVIVVGSGLAGLTAAATAARAGARVALIEGHTRGGRARTEERDGFSLNLGPHAVYDGGPGHAVLDDLGVTLRGARPPKAGTLGWDDHTAPLPQGIGALVSPFLGAADKARLARAMAKVARTEPAAVAHLTTAEWLEGLLPERPRQVLATLVRVGTYSADFDLVSADVAVHQLKAAARGVTYLHGGWAQLTDALRTAAGSGVEAVHASATAVDRDIEGPFVRTDDGRVRRAGRVVVASGSPAAAATLLPGGAPASWDRLGPAVTASCLDLGLRRPPEIPSWFGVDRPHYLVAHAPGADLAPTGSALVHAMRNLHHDGTTSADELRADLWTLAGRAGITHDDVVLDRYLHRMVVISASVTPAGGGLAGRPDVTDTGVDGVLVAGDWVGPSGWLADASLVSGAAAGRLAAEQARSEGEVTTGARR